MIMITIIAIVVYGCIHIKDQGEVEFDTVPFLNEKTYTQSIGFSVYAFEGIGLIIPVQDVTALEEPQYRKVVFLVFFSCAMIFIVFGQFCVFAWGDQIQTSLITDNLPENTIIDIVKFLFCLNLVFSYPL
jgi:proton-coupled amino acid transporter